MSRRRGAGGAVGLAAGLVAGGLVLAACTGGSPRPEGPAGSGLPSSDSPASVSPSASGPADLTLAVYGQPGLVRAYERMADRFAERRDRISVETVDAGSAEGVAELLLGNPGAAAGTEGAEGDAGDAGDEGEAGEAAGTPAPDVFVIDQDHLPTLLAEQQVQRVDALLGARGVNFGDGFQRAGLEAFAEDAGLQCMPHDVSPRVVYYNRDLVDLRRAGSVPGQPVTAEDGWTWEEFTRAARRAARGPAEGVYLEPSLASLAPFVWSAGADIVDDPTFPDTLTLAEGDTREALETVLSVVRDPVITPTEEEVRRTRPLTRFKQGRLGMILGTRALTPTLRKAEDLDFDVMPLPRLGAYRSIADMTGYCISADTEHVQAAADLVAFASGREGASITAESGYVVPANLQVANSASFTQSSQQPRASFVFNETVRRTQSTPAVVEWREMEQRITPLLDRLFHAPVIDLDTLLADIDAVSGQILLGEPEETTG